VFAPANSRDDSASLFSAVVAPKVPCPGNASPNTVIKTEKTDRKSKNLRIIMRIGNLDLDSRVNALEYTQALIVPPVIEISRSASAGLAFSRAGLRRPPMTSKITRGGM
jgi:hypothetical protein